MQEQIIFVFNSVLLGLGLAMDAFSVSLANGLNEPRMRTSKMCGVAGVFAVFQALMPLIGWLCIHTLAEKFSAFERFIPWIALLLLGYIGGKMLIEGIKSRNSCDCMETMAVGIGALLVQGIATSIDALAVGFTISEYTLLPALLCALIIALVTFIVCVIGIQIGKIFGVRLACKASIFGGVILIIIGLEIFLKGILA
jgi:putative Mn2+ efflux pump MntP